MRREVPLLLTFLFGGFVVLSNFVVWQPWKTAAESVNNWALIVIAFTTVLGVGNVFRLHGLKISRREPGWGYSAATLCGLLVMVVFGIVLGIIAWIFLGWRQQILWLVFKIAGVPFGSLLGVFLLGLLSRRRVADVANVVSMVVMTLINLALLYLSETGRINFPWSWLVIVGTAGTIALSLALTPALSRRR